MIDVLDARLVPIDTELTRLARADGRAVLLRTIPGVGWLLGLTFPAEIGEISRFPSAGKLVGYSGLVPRVRQSGESSRTGRLAKAGSPLLRWAAVEAAQRPQNPWHRLYVDVRKRHGHGNAAKSAVARKILIAVWHVWSRQQPFTPAASTAAVSIVPASSGQPPGRLTAPFRIEKPGQLPPDTMRRPSAERELSLTSASPEPPELPVAC